MDIKDTIDTIRTAIHIELIEPIDNMDCHRWGCCDLAMQELKEKIKEL